MNISKNSNNKRKKGAIVFRVLIIELLISAVLLSVLLVAMPRIFYAAVREQALSNAAIISEQALSGINSLMEDLDEYSRRISSNRTVRNLIYSRDDEMAQLQLQNELSNMYFVDNYLVVSGMIVFEDNTTIKAYGCTAEDDRQIEANWFVQYRDKGYNRYYWFDDQESDGIEKLYYATPFDNYQGERADIVLICTFQPFKQILNKLDSNYPHVAILNREIQCMFPADVHTNWLENVLGRIRENGKVNETVIEEDDELDILYKTSLGGWMLAINMNRDYLLAPYRQTIMWITLAVAAYFLILQIALIPTLVRVLNPIHTLAKTMQEVANGNLQVRSEIKSGDEIEMLGHTFNDMLSRLNDYMDTILEKEKIQQKMKYSLLISQIDPHFIYNTMNSITYLAKNKRHDDVIVVNRSLMNMLRDRLRISDIEFFDSIEREMEIVENYITIQRYRYGDCFELASRIPDALRHKHIPKNVIQPLVENALLHGLLPNKDDDGSILGGVIIISVDQDHDSLHIVVRNEGREMAPEKVVAFNRGERIYSKARGEHIGLENIRERLSYMYGNQFRIWIESNTGQGVAVHIILDGEIDM